MSKKSDTQKEWTSRLKRQEKLLKSRREAQAVLDKINKKLESNNARLNDLVKVTDINTVPSVITVVDS